MALQKAGIPQQPPGIPLKQRRGVLKRCRGW
jgi:hypothetical protein